MNSSQNVMIDKKKVISFLEQHKNRIIASCMMLLLIIFGTLWHLKQGEHNSVEDFFKNRQSVESYHHLNEQEAAKKKAERNVFLQD